MTFSVVIPYFNPQNDEHRADALGFVAGRWRSDFPDCEIVYGEANGNRSRARNEAAAQASGDILVICDADTTYVDPAQIERALSDPHWSRTGVNYKLDRDTTHLVAIDGWWQPELFTYETVWPDSPGGIQVVSAKQFWSIGGFDGGFDGWGYEDTAFCLAMNTIHGRPSVHGDVIHLWHPTSRDERQEQPDIKRNQRRYGGYQRAAARGPQAMMTLLHSNGTLS